MNSTVNKYILSLNYLGKPNSYKGKKFKFLIDISFNSSVKIWASFAQTVNNIKTEFLICTICSWTRIFLYKCCFFFFFKSGPCFMLLAISISFFGMSLPSLGQFFCFLFSFFAVRAFPFSPTPQLCSLLLSQYLSFWLKPRVYLLYRLKFFFIHWFFWHVTSFMLLV